MFKNFLGQSPTWFKMTILSLLVMNLVLYFGLPLFIDAGISHQILAWIFIAEFIFCLAMALQCYPLQSGGLFAIQIVFLGLTSPKNAYLELSNNLEVLLLLLFMIAGIYFMKPLLMYIFSRVFVKIKSKILLSFSVALIAALLSAFLDALTVTAVLISVCVGFFVIYHKIRSDYKSDYNHDGVPDGAEIKKYFRRVQIFFTKYYNAWCRRYSARWCNDLGGRTSKFIDW